MELSTVIPNNNQAAKLRDDGIPNRFIRPTEMKVLSGIRSLATMPCGGEKQHHNNDYHPNSYQQIKEEGYYRGGGGGGGGGGLRLLLRLSLLIYSKVIRKRDIYTLSITR